MAVHCAVLVDRFVKVAGTMEAAAASTFVIQIFGVLTPAVPAVSTPSFYIAHI